MCEIDWAYLNLEHRLVKFTAKEKDGTTIETNWGKVITGETFMKVLYFITCVL